MADFLCREFLAFFLALSFFVSGVLGSLSCEQIDRSACAFAVSSSGMRCVLEKRSRGANGEEEGSKCHTSCIKAAVVSGWIETDDCVTACGLERETFGISSDSLHDRRFIQRLCSPDCYQNCPNIVDYFFSVAAGEGVFLPNLCSLNGARREMKEEMLAASGPASPMRKMTELLDDAPAPKSSSERNMMESEEMMESADAPAPKSSSERNLMDFDDDFTSEPISNRKLMEVERYMTEKEDAPAPAPSWSS